MKKFMGDNFLLNTESAKKLYHDYAETMPILDYHCHINPEQIANDYRFKTITEAWLGGDHYKWRMMRNDGRGRALYHRRRAAIGKSSWPMPRCCRAQSATRCTTGRIWS